MAGGGTGIYESRYRGLRLPLMILLGKTTFWLPTMPPPPKVRYNLGICCGSSNLLHNVSVCGGVPSSCFCGSPLTCAVWHVLFTDIFMMLHPSWLVFITCRSLRFLVLVICSSWNCPFQEVTHCALLWTVLQGFVDITSMFFLLSSLPMLVSMLPWNLGLVTSLSMSLLALLILLHMTR